MTSLHFFTIFLFLVVDPRFGSLFVSSTELVLEFKVDGEELEQHDVEERGETGSEEDDVALSPIAISVSSCKILPFNTSISLSRASMKGFLSASSALSSVTSLKRLTLSMLSLAFPPLSRHNCFFFFVAPRPASKCLPVFVLARKPAI